MCVHKSDSSLFRLVKHPTLIDAKSATSRFCISVVLLRSRVASECNADNVFSLLDERSDEFDLRRPRRLFSVGQPEDLVEDRFDVRRDLLD